MSVPIATSPGRSGFGPQLSLTYDSGAGNGPFGFGWSLSLPSITRRTDLGLPRYDDAHESDVFILSGAEDLVPEYRKTPDGSWVRDAAGRLVVHEYELDGHCVRRYRPRVEGSFARIERWSKIGAPQDVHWRSISGDNVLTLYGLTSDSRISDPADVQRTFTWLICETRDDKGNGVLYRYAAEDGAGADLGAVHQRNRGPRDDDRRAANRYLRRIHYGNRATLLDGDGRRPRFLDPAQIEGQLTRREWMFEVVFDYGQHSAETPTPGGGASWLHRRDAFSSYRSGFEVRTARLCRRVLMFHHIPADAGVGNDCLVRSTDLGYWSDAPARDGSDPGYAFLRSVTQTGYRRNGGGYDRLSMPPVEFQYAEPRVQDTVEDVEPESLRNLPAGLYGATTRWTDLHGEGIPGVLSEQAGAWFYKRNLSPVPQRSADGRERVRARFGPLELVATKPEVSLSAGGELMDLAGDGLPDVVVLDGASPGLYEHDDAEGWKPFRPFASRLTRDLRDPNVRFVDLDGDGHADVLITEDDALVWHASLEEAGFGAAHRVAASADEEQGPRIIFADGTDSVHLADFSGDGLDDIVRIRNGEVSYWPNLGHGRFAAKVTMDDSPWFDQPDQFDPGRIRLADIDGSGTTDIIYLHRDGVRLYFNSSGNRWGAPVTLTAFAPLDDVVDVVTTDLLGNGTSCLVWSSPLAGDARRPMRYVDLMGGRKPHLLTRIVNNLGAETHIEYAPSTAFYLRDREEGRPWIMRLPFPVHVVERVETFDHVSRNRFSTRYAYHHGYYDGADREFRGFGMVEQWDTEQVPTLVPGEMTDRYHVPPVYTRTWFHTGVGLGRGDVSAALAGMVDATDAGEYFREPGLTDAQARELLLPDTVLPPSLSPAEEHEACRALKGSMLRQEVYALDGSEAQAYPYTVTEQNFTVRVLQPRGWQRHGVFFSHAREVIDHEYERNPVDPRVHHAITLDVDDFGNILQEAAVGYGRRPTISVQDADGQWRRRPNPGLGALSVDDRATQTTSLLTFSEHEMTEAVDTADAHRNPLPAQVRTFELTGFPASGPAGRYRPADLVEPDPARPGRVRLLPADDADFHDVAGPGPGRRTIDWQRTLYRRDDLTGLLPLGRLHELGLPGESYRLAFTPGLLDRILQRPHSGAPTEVLLPDPVAVLGGQGGDQGGYLRSQTLVADGRFPATDADDYWWLPSGQSFFTTKPLDDAATESAAARGHFYLTRRYRDPFDQDAFVDFDDDDLLITETRDALGNRVTADVNDYRVLSARMVSDPNRNRTAVAFDALGMVVGTAVMGKPPPAPAEGDSLTGFVADLTSAQIVPFLDAPDPRPAAAGLLGNAGSRIMYDLDRFRRTRQAYPDDPDRWEPVCAATLAREMHANGPAPIQGQRIRLVVVHSDGYGREIQQKIPAEPAPAPAEAVPRWVGTGWTVYNNKGKPVRQYEPFFSATHRFEFAVLSGVSPVLFYDPPERVLATLYPDDTYDKVVFDAWQQSHYDANDTCAPRNGQTGDLRTDPDVRGYLAAYFEAADPGGTWQPWHEQRIHGALGTDERTAAERAAAHADTPTTAHLDPLGRTFLTVTRNRVVCAGHDLDGTEATLCTRVDLDVQGNVRMVRDATSQPDPRGRVVARYAYDLLGRRIRQVTADAGARWRLDDAAGGPIRTWDDRGHNTISAYDRLRRLAELRVRGTTPQSDPRTLNRDTVVERIEYGERLVGAEALNLRTRIYRHLDGAGIAVNARLQADGTPIRAFDFKGNVLHTTRQLAADYEALPDWSGPVTLQNETFEQSTRYDALNRVVQSTAAHSDLVRSRRNVVQPVFNEANLLERVDVWLGRATEPAGLLDPAQEAPSPVGVAGIQYDAGGRRLQVDHRNGVVTRYRYDPATFRLLQIYTRRDAAFTGDCDNPQPPPSTMAAPEVPPPGVACGVQNLSYTYDPVGNITHVADSAQQIVYFRNQRVEPSNDYTYDALYRLIEATGREHLGQTAGVRNPPRAPDALYNRLAHPADGNALGTYIERYMYDAVGNFCEIQHRGSDPVRAGWTRTYEYLAGTNQLGRITVNPDGAAPAIEPYAHDSHGNIVGLPHLGSAPSLNMHWDHRDRLRRTDVPGGVVHYTYDGSGTRVRKVWLKTPAIVEERIYLAGFEIFRRHRVAKGALVNDSTATLERETLHVSEAGQRFAVVETRTLDTLGVDVAPPRLIRYQYGNQLGTVCLELDDAAQIISYEEFAPYGSTTFHAVRSMTETPKRYRFTGKEHDEESGFCYHGARYYVPWLGRWASCDPAAADSSPFDPATSQPYIYVQNKPVVAHDPDGKVINFAAALIGAGVGAVVGGGIEAARQYLTTGKVSDWKAVGASAAGGAVSGAVAGLTMGASLAVQATAAVASGVAGGAVTRQLSGQQHTTKAVLLDAAIGLVTFGVVKGGSAAVTALRGGTAAASSGVRAVVGSGSKAATTSSSTSVAATTTRAGLRSTAAASETSAARTAVVEAAEAARPMAPSSGAVATTSAREAAADAGAPAAASEAVARVELIEKMTQIVRDSARVADDAIARGDRAALEEFLTPRETARLLQGGRLSQAFRGVFVEWRSRMMFALDEAIQPHVGRGGFVGNRGAVVRGVPRRGFADFFGTTNGLLSNIAIDITTQARYAAHLARGYLEKGLVLTY
jgi:RHS repeat-associated protein